MSRISSRHRVPTRRLSRRQALQLAGSFAVAPLMASWNLPARSAPPIRLKWISVERGEPRNRGMRRAVEVFEQHNPNVKVDLELVPFDQYFQKIAIALSSGSGVDVFDVDSPLVTSYAVQGALLPLDPYIDMSDWQDFVEVERKTATYQGESYRSRGRRRNKGSTTTSKCSTQQGSNQPEAPAIGGHGSRPSRLPRS